MFLAFYRMEHCNFTFGYAMDEALSLSIIFGVVLLFLGTVFILARWLYRKVGEKQRKILQDNKRGL